MNRQEENDEVIDAIIENAKINPAIITNTILADISRSLAVIADALMENNNKEFKEITRNLKQNINHTLWSNLKNGTPIPPIEESRSDGSGIYRS